MILQTLLDQVPSAPRDQREDMRMQLLLGQPLARWPFIDAVAMEPLLAAAATLAFRRLDEDVARRQPFTLVYFGNEIAIGHDDLKHGRARDAGLRAAAKEQQLVLQRFLGAPPHPLAGVVMDKIVEAALQLVAQDVVPRIGE